MATLCTVATQILLFKKVAKSVLLFTLEQLGSELHRSIYNTDFFFNKYILGPLTHHMCMGFTPMEEFNQPLMEISVGDWSNPQMWNTQIWRADYSTIFYVRYFSIHRF